MKLLFIPIILISLSLCTNAAIITGQVEYTEQSAKEELLNTIPASIPKEQFRANIFDYDNTENTYLLLKGQTELKDRTLARFSDGSYAVMYYNDKMHVWYYTQDGRLTHSEVKTSEDYPYKTYKYNTSGKLINMSLRPSKDETFIYSPDGKLIAHWLKNKCYDQSGKVIMTRKYEL